MSFGTRSAVVAALAALAIAACQAVESRGQPDTEDSGTGSDTDTDSDSDSDADSDSDSDADAGNVEFSYMWVSNSAEGTLSKVDTILEEEVARYRTCSVASCDPSRTSVNLAGDMAVTNRSPEYDAMTPSSVVKFAATLDRCVDRNEDTII